MIRTVTSALCIVLATVVPANAIDHKNLDEGRPLRVEDAYPIAHDELAIEAGAGLTLQRRGADRGLFPVELLYGPLPNLQVGIGTALSTDPHDIEDRPRSGDLRLSALYNFNQETLTLPAFALKVGVDEPTGVDAHGFGVEAKGIVTKSVERLSLHLNAGYEFITSSREDERDGRYKLAIGASYPVGAPASPAPRWSQTSSLSSRYVVANRPQLGRRWAFGTNSRPVSSGMSASAQSSLGRLSAQSFH